MKFCPACAHPLEQRIPEGDTRMRAVCPSCGSVHYENPRVVVGCVPVWQGRILLCQRAIMPRRGFWTTPAGFLENGETLQEAAARESLEEAHIRVQIGSLLSVTHVLHARQVHVNFRARMLDEHFAAGIETLQAGLYEEASIPWDQIAFPSITFALRCYLEDHRQGREAVHFSTAQQPLPQHP